MVFLSFFTEELSSTKEKLFFLFEDNPTFCHNGEIVFFFRSYSIIEVNLRCITCHIGSMEYFFVLNKLTKLFLLWRIRI